MSMHLRLYREWFELKVLKMLLVQIRMPFTVPTEHQIK